MIAAAHVVACAIDGSDDSVSYFAADSASAARAFSRRDLADRAIGTTLVLPPSPPNDAPLEPTADRTDAAGLSPRPFAHATLSMCGIVGYVGSQVASAVISDGLDRLEYRGYDSAGIAVLVDHEIIIRRATGPVRNLITGSADLVAARVGIGHTRWATHGPPSLENAHPQVDCTGSFAVVHNGVIANHQTLRRSLISRGHTFRSETDTEVVPHLLEEHAGGDFATSVRKVVDLLRGDSAFAILSKDAPDTIVVTRCGSPPLIVGLGDGEQFIASDLVPLIRHTRRVVALEEGDLAVLTRDAVEILPARGGGPVRRPLLPVTWDPEAAERAGHAHFMHKEIHEQPEALRRTVRDRIAPDARDLRADALPLSTRDWQRLRRITIVGCGTSYHAGLIGRRLFETLAHVRVDVDVASEFRDRDPLIGPGDLCVFISQSGETADTLGALRVAKGRGARAVAVCNVPGSSMIREADEVVMTSTGPEIGVASTKAFTAQVAVMLLMAVRAARARGRLTETAARSTLHDLLQLPALIAQTLGREQQVIALAHQCRSFRDFFFLGRGIGYPVALEGALKLKEIAYVHAEAFPAGEMKHGPLALVDANTVTVVLAPAGPVRSKMLATIEEVKARGGKIVAVCTEGDDATALRADGTLSIPRASDLLVPCLLTVPLQLFAYHMAVLGDCDVDRPRNLAKSVTVE